MNVLKYGSRGDDVKLLQSKLHCIEDGIFGKITEEAVKNFQKEHNLVVDGIVGQKTWDALEILNLKTSRNIKYIFIHCTATPEGKNFTTEQITQWHIARGFQTIGYHFVIYLDGSIHAGRNIDIIPAAQTGFNTGSIAISYVGGCEKDGVTPKDTRNIKQKESLLNLLLDLKKIYPNAKIKGHNEVTKLKACPSFDV